MRFEQPAWAVALSKRIDECELLLVDLECRIMAHGYASCRGLARLCEEHRAIRHMIDQARRLILEHGPERIVVERGDLYMFLGVR